jgi:hypothetical protein
MLHYFADINFPAVLVYSLYAIAVGLLYHNRHALLYEEGNLSLGRIWGWTMFYLACQYWTRYLAGLVPPTTPFPPGLEEMLYAILVYEFSKKCTSIADLLSSTFANRHGKSKNRGEETWTEDEKPPRIGGDNG